MSKDLRWVEWRRDGWEYFLTGRAAPYRADREVYSYAAIRGAEAEYFCEYFLSDLLERNEEPVFYSSLADCQQQAMYDVKVSIAGSILDGDGCVGV